MNTKRKASRRSVARISKTPAENSCKLSIGSTQVSAIWLTPAKPLACFVFAHGAGAGMTHPFMAEIARALIQHNIATLRYQFPYMEQGSRRPDPPALCHATVRAAVTEAHRCAPSVPLFAGGKSFGGRMTSQAQALESLPHVRGLMFLGFPLHPAGKPGDSRADHLSTITTPMLFVQGTRDPLAELTLLRPLIRRLGKYATLSLSEQADHSFHVPVRSGRKDSDVKTEMAKVMSEWLQQVAAR